MQRKMIQARNSTKTILPSSYRSLNTHRNAFPQVAMAAHTNATAAIGISRIKRMVVSMAVTSFQVAKGCFPLSPT